MGRKNKEVTNKAYRFLLKPTDEQKVLFVKTFGCCRFIWNIMLDDKRRYYKDTGEMLMVTPAIYKTLPDFSWLNEVDSLALANVQLHLEAAYSSFFKGKSGFPKFKKKGATEDSYTTNNPKLNGNFLTVPKCKTPIHIIRHRAIAPNGKLKSVTIIREPNGKYYASLLFEYQPVVNDYIIDTDKAVGLDMSAKELFVSSDGDLGNYPRFYREAQVKLAKEQRKLSHMKKKSSNYIKQQNKVARLHAKTKHQRNNFLHQTSRALVNRYDIVCIEDLNMKAMSQCLNLGKSVMDNGWGTFTRQLNYKLKDKGGTLIKIDKWFPSSKTCMVCGHKYETLTLKDRIYACPECGNIVDRDYQAAVNILKEGLRVYEAAVG